MPHSPLLLPALDARGPLSLGRLLGASLPLALVDLARAYERPMIVLGMDSKQTNQLEAELRFFAGDALPVQHFAEWETLPYDAFSPHQDIVSQRLSVLAALKAQRQGITVASVPAMLQRLPPKSYIGARTLSLAAGQTLDRDGLIESLSACGYLRVPQVEEHGEFAVRGALFDVFPMGSERPIRIDLFDDDIESLRYFDPQTQVSNDRVASVEVLPASEIPLDGDSVRAFRERYRERFEGRPSASRVYSDVSNGIAHGGIEYYLPLFFDESATFLDYCPSNAIVVSPNDIDDLLTTAWDEIVDRYEICNIDAERPILKPEESFFSPDDVKERLAHRKHIAYSAQSLLDADRVVNVATQKPPPMRVDANYDDAAAALQRFLDSFDGRVLFVADSPGRRETVLDFLRGRGVSADRHDDWSGFLTARPAAASPSHHSTAVCCCRMRGSQSSRSKNCSATIPANDDDAGALSATLKRLFDSSTTSAKVRRSCMRTMASDVISAWSSSRPVAPRVSS